MIEQISTTDHGSYIPNYIIRKGDGNAPVFTKMFLPNMRKLNYKVLSLLGEV